MKVCNKRVFIDAAEMQLVPEGHAAAASLFGIPGQRFSEQKLKDRNGDPFEDVDEFFVDPEDYRPPTLDQKKVPVMTRSSILGTSEESDESLQDGAGDLGEENSTGEAGNEGEPARKPSAVTRVVRKVTGKKK